MLTHTSISSFFQVPGTAVHTHRNQTRKLERCNRLISLSLQVSKSSGLLLESPGSFPRHCCCLSFLQVPHQVTSAPGPIPATARRPFKSPLRSAALATAVSHSLPSWLLQLNRLITLRVFCTVPPLPGFATSPLPARACSGKLFLFLCSFGVSWQGRLTALSQVCRSPLRLSAGAELRD